MSRRDARLLTLLAGALLPALLAVPVEGVARSAPAGHIGCGAVLGPGSVTVLDSDVGPCDDNTNPAITLIGPATLSLGGFKVICEDLDGKRGVPDGILLDGTQAKLVNGTVTGCNTGVVVKGTGEHKVKQVTALDSVVAGMAIRSSSNRILRSAANAGRKVGFFVAQPDNSFRKNKASDNAGNGFDIKSARNRVRDSSAAGNGGPGYAVQGGKNKLTGNTATGNAVGYAVGGSRNNLLGNGADANTGAGVTVAGKENTLEANNITNNGGDGVAISGRTNKATQNTISGNAGNGIHVQLGAENNNLLENVVTDNGPDGILVEGTGNRIRFNTATGHAVFDLEDTNPLCDDNSWRKNTYGTRNQKCVR